MITHQQLQKLLLNFSKQKNCKLTDLEYLLEHFGVSRTKELRDTERSEFFWIVNDLLFGIRHEK